MLIEQSTHRGRQPRVEQRGPVQTVNQPQMIRRWAEDYSVLKSNDARSFLDPRGLENLLESLRKSRFKVRRHKFACRGANRSDCTVSTCDGVRRRSRACCVIAEAPTLRDPCQQRSEGDQYLGLAAVGTRQRITSRHRHAVFVETDHHVLFGPPPARPETQQADAEQRQRRGLGHLGPCNWREREAAVERRHRVVGRRRIGIRG
jgi:hypothetical protein